MKIFFLSLSLFYSLNSFAQVDTIFQSNGEVLPVIVKEVNETSIKYVFPNEEVMNSISKNAVAKIHYKSGRVEEYSSSLNLLEVQSGLDFENVQISKLESEISGLYKIDNIDVKASGATTMSSIAKIQERAYSKLKMAAAMIGSNVVLINQQNTESAQYGGQFGGSKAPTVTISGICYTSKKVKSNEIVFGNYEVSHVFYLGANDYEIMEGMISKESFEIKDANVVYENNFPKINLKTKSLPDVQSFVIIYASPTKLILSGIYTSENGKKKYYNLVLRKI